METVFPRIHLHLIDERFKAYRWNYILQSLAATFILFLVLFLEDAAERAVIIAAIGSTTFILFVMPRSTAAGTRHVLGGHLIAVIIGGALAAFSTSTIGQSLLNISPLIFEMEAAFAVGLSVLAMAATNTEHAPAAGTALGVVVHTFSWGLVLFVLSSVVLLTIGHRLFRPWLRDLL